MEGVVRNGSGAYRCPFRVPNVWSLCATMCASALDHHQFDLPPSKVPIARALRAHLSIIAICERYFCASAFVELSLQNAALPCVPFAI